MERHINKPYKYANEIPAFIRKNVLKQAIQIKIPETDFMRLVSDLGVQYAPDKNKILRLAYTGVPNGPLDLSKLVGLR